MSSFHYRFERILRHKRQREELLQQQLALKERSLHEARLEKEQIRRRLATEEDRLREFQRGTLQVDQLVMMTQFIDSLRQALVRQQQIVQEAMAERDECRELLTEAMKERKLFETLKEKRLEKFQIEQARREQRLMDEMAQHRLSHPGGNRRIGGA